MSKWNKNHGLIVPIDSLLKEKENTNRPAPLRSAGLVGRWGITSFTSIRNTSYEFESTSPKESDELSCSSNLASLSTQLPAAPKPKKFFKSRNSAPPATPDPHRHPDGSGGLYHQQIVQHQAAQLQARINQKAGGSPPYVPPAAGFYTQQQSSSKSPAKEEVVKEKKKPGRKKKVKPVEVAEPPPPQPPTSEEPLPVDPEVPDAVAPSSEETPAAASSSKKEKKEKKEKKSKKVKKEPELPPELPKRNSSRIRNKVVNYNEDDDSFDSPIPFRNVDTPPVGPSKLAAEPATAKAVEEVTPAAPEPPVVPVPQPSPGKVKEPKAVTAVPVPLSSPSVLEHPPIVLRISKGTSRLVSTDSEDVHSPPHGTTPNSATIAGTAAAPSTPSHQSTPPQHVQQTLPPPSPPRREPEHQPAVVPPLIIKPPVAASPPEEVPRKDDLKIKISLSKSSLISNGAGGTSGVTVGSGSKKKESKKELRHFKKRAIAREQKGSTRASKRVRRGEEVVGEEDREEVEDEQLLGGVAEDLRVDPIVIPVPPRPSFPLPGTDAYELYRTLASPSGGDDFDSQSSILGSASSNATPKHGGIAAAEDCRIIHSRGSSDCGSDLELSQNSQNSQNSSTAAAPPSEINFESENTQELREEEPAAAAAKEEVAPAPKEERVEVLKLSLKGTRATRSTRSSRMKGAQIEVMSKPEPVPVPAPEVVSPAEPPVKKFGRATRQRNNNNNVVNAATPEEKLPEVVPVEPVREPSPPPVVQKTATRQYNRRKKNVIPPDYQPEVTSPNRKQPPTAEEPPPFTLQSESGPLLASIQTTPEDLTTNSRTAPAPPEPAPMVQDENKPEPTEYKIKNKFKRNYFRAEELAKQAAQAQQQQVLVESAAQNVAGIPSGAGAAALTVPQISIPAGASSSQETVSSDGGPAVAPVKLVISKKKGSIFKSRPLVGSAEAADKKRHVYKHKWDDDGDQEGKEKAALLAEKQQEKEVDTFEGEPSGLSRVPRTAGTSGAPTAFDEDDDDEFDFDAKLKCNRNAKPYYTVVRNVKKAHQIQEIGESQEMDDDVEYILSALQSDNPIATRCLSAMTLATKCMTPAFRMHVRAHGVVTRFFKALQDAHRDQSLGLCTATIMFVLSQDTLNMDLDRDSLELMLNLLDTDHHRTDAQPDPQTRGQLEKNRSKVRELCEEIKNSGKAKHMDLDAITVGSLAMESLLSLTSKRAGDWFKDELRNLGGLEHLIKTVTACCREISDYVIEWTDELLSKLQKIERCLRVLENVTLLNEQNQSYILNYNGGSLVATLAKLFKLVDGEVVLYPTNERTPKEDRGAVLREVIPPILKIFISLTHPFNDTAYGAGVIGSQPHVIETTLHLLLRVGDYVPQKFIFEMNILVLLFLINLSMYTQANRTRLMTARAPDDYGTPEDSPRQSRDEMAVQALVEYFYRQDELARYAEKNTDAILDAKSKKNEDIEETVTKLLQKAGHHMEHTLMASYVCLLIGWLVIGSEENEATVRTYLREGNFVMMVSSLEKYYNFLNLTANSDALSLQHVRQTKNIIDNLKRLDAADRVPQPEASTSQRQAPVQQQPPQAPHRYGSRSSTRAHY